MKKSNKEGYDYESKIQNYRREEAKVLEDGSIFIPERIVPVPKSISKEAQVWMRTDHALSEGSEGLSIEQVRESRQKIWETLISRARSIYPVTISDTKIGGIDCIVVEPESGIADKNKDKILINIFPGAGITGHKNTVDAIPVANLLEVKVICPQYRLMPEHPFPAAIDDLEKTYKGLLEQYKSENIGVYGASQGAYYTFQLCSRLMFNEIPMPGAIASWGGGGEIGDGGLLPQNDSYVLNEDLDPIVRNNYSASFLKSKVKIDNKDPLVSPIYADLSKFPPAFLATGTRDPVLSSTVMMHTALKKAGNEAELFVFEGMHHLFSAMHDLPETKDLQRFTVLFFKKHLQI